MSRLAIAALLLWAASSERAVGRGDSRLVSDRALQPLSLRGGILGGRQRRERREQRAAEKEAEAALDAAVAAATRAELTGAEAESAPEPSVVDEPPTTASAVEPEPEPEPAAPAPAGGEGGGSAVAAALLGAAMSQSTPPPAAAAAPSGETAEDEDDGTPLGAALARLRASAGPAYGMALDTLVTVVSNVRAHPDERKFRRLRLNNALIKTRLRALDGGAECLFALGFRQEGEVGDAAAYVLDDVDEPALAAAAERLVSVRSKAVVSEQAAKSAAAGLLDRAPEAVKEALAADAELRSAASAMVAHPLFSHLMGDAGFAERATFAANDPRGLRALVEAFSTGRIEPVSSREAWFDLLLDNKCVVALFSAKWCGPCKLLRPIVAHLSQVPSLSKLKFVHVDGDELPVVAQEAHVSAYPTVKLFVDCREQETVVGGDVQKLVRVLEAAASSAYSR